MDAIDVAHVRDGLETMLRDADADLAFETPILQGLDHESVGIEYADVDRKLIVGSGLNAFPIGGVDKYGPYSQTVTIGAFDRGDVEDAIEPVETGPLDSWFLEDAARDDHGDFGVFSAHDFSIGVTDGLIVAGCDHVVRASIDCYEGDAESYLNDRSFFAVRRHDPLEKTDVQNGKFEGEVAVADGHTVTDDGLETRIVRAFDDEDDVDEDAVERWADDVLQSLLDLDIQVENRRVVIEERAEADEIPSRLAGFSPFSSAYGDL